jgi:hypothetical protein
MTAIDLTGSLAKAGVPVFAQQLQTMLTDRDQWALIWTMTSTNCTPASSSLSHRALVVSEHLSCITVRGRVLVRAVRAALYGQVLKLAGGGHVAERRRCRAIEPSTAAIIARVLQLVVKADHIDPGRPAATKTGTQACGDIHDNQDAWLAGFLSL